MSVRGIEASALGNPKVHFDELAVGQTREAVVVENLSRTQIVQYAGASGDFNPIHHDEIFATQVAGYPSTFAHGMLTMGLTGKLLTDWLGDGVLRSFGVRFVRQVWPGDTLTAKATVASLETGEDGGLVAIEVVTSNQKGEPVVKGQATAALPLRT
jgi:acyl dehydratase